MKSLVVTFKHVQEDSGAGGIVGPFLKKLALAAGISEPVFVEWTGKIWRVHDALGNVVMEAVQ